VAPPHHPTTPPPHHLTTSPPTTPQTRDLRDGGTLYYDAAFWSKADADALLAALRRDVPWKQEAGRGRPFPRLTAWFADPGLTYTYSGVTHQATPWTPLLQEIRRRVEEASGASFNSLLANLYRDGRDSIGFHTDAEPELGLNPVVASVSLGAEREFVLKHKATRDAVKLRLAHGSLLVMGGTCQHHWLHGMPKTDETVGERINLTFRKILTDARKS
jgi:alkylated DNA repair dioxygenase AlkB